MKNLTWIFVAALFLAACNLSDSIEFSGDFTVGDMVEGTLELETPDTFNFDFNTGTFIYGICDQLSVDVVVSLLDSTGTALGQFDGPAQGPEIFHFEIDEAGPYKLVVGPFEDKTGDYTLELKVVEPVATNAEKRADQLFYAYSEEGVPGGVVGVIHRGELIFSKAYGLANLTHDLPYQVSTPTNIGSVSKQFTAFAILLAEIVERISGMSFPEFMEEQVFGPLGMNSSVVRANPSVIIPGASQGYVRDSTGYREAGDLYAAYGAGGIYTTVEDFSKWMGNFSRPLVGGLELVNKLVTVDTLNNGDTMSYALGIGVGEYRGLTVYSHGGADIAHRAFLVYFPEIDGGVVAMSNNGSFGSAQIAYEMANMYFGEEMEPEEGEDEVDGEMEETEDEAVTVPDKLLEAYAGEYLLSAMGIKLEYKLDNGVLIFSTEGQPNASLIPLSTTEFRYEGVDATIEFKTDGQEEVTGAVHSQGGQKFELERLAPYMATIEDLQELTGTFYSKELATFYTLEVRDTTLVLLIRNTKEIELSSLKEDSYKGDIYFIGEVVFQRDTRGHVNGIYVSNGRTRGIEFVKQ